MFSECFRRCAAARGSLLPAAFLLALAAGCASTGVYHVVEPGQTLYRIARAYEVEEGYLARVNGINDPTRIEVGRRLYIPGASVPRQVPSSMPAKSLPPATAAPAAKRDAPKAAAAPATKSKPPAVKAAPPVRPGELPGPPPAAGTFVWPARGQVVTEFGTAGGKSSKGIEIALPHATPVVASAAGKVIYSSNGIPGYGNLIILEHADSFFTVYGFNSKNLAAVNSFVGQGERIALSGTPSGGRSPRLHFEIRKGKLAVNPIFFLP